MRRDQPPKGPLKRALTLVGLLLCVVAAVVWWSGQGTSSVEPANDGDVAVTRSTGRSGRQSGAAETPRSNPATAASRVLDLRRDAEAGDPVAMRELSELILNCSFGLNRGSDFWSGVESTASRLNPVDQAALRAAATRVGSQCENLPPGTRTDLALRYRQLLADAAEKGDLLARLRQRGRASMPDMQAALPDDADTLIDDALASDDPRALLELSMIYSPVLPKAPPRFGVGSNPDDHTALILLACERGMDCGVGSAHHDALCVVGLMCSDDFEEMVRKQAQGDGEMERVNERLEWLRRLLDEMHSGR